MPPVLALVYWLHPRRTPRRRPASGVFLWRRAAARRRRRLDLGLLLSLLAGALAVLGLARPWVAGRPTAVAVVLDASASMAAGERWSRALAFARRRLAGAPRAVAVRAGVRPRVLGPAPGEALARRLEGLRPGDPEADLRAAAAAARAALPGAAVWVVSDAAPPPGVGYKNVADDAPNLGIVGLRPGFLAVGNAGPGAKTATLRVNGRLRRLRVPERGFAGLELSQEAPIHAELVGGDALGLDDRDDLVRRAPRVWAPPKDPGLARMLRLLGVRPVGEESAEAAILEAVPQAPPDRPTLFFAPRAQGRATVADRDPADPLLRGSGLLGEELPVPPPPGPGFRAVASGPAGEGLVWRAGGSYYLPPIADLENRPYFPLFVARFLAPFRYPKRRLGTDGVWTPGVRAGVAYALEAPYETLLPRPRPDRPAPAAGRRPLAGPFFLAAALLLLAESRLPGRLGG